LGMIVANTAKNMLKKKNPLLFSDVAVDENDENFEYQIEDENIDNQPETAYTRQETQELVHELIDSLSEEQRVCILMFHIEGASISEIAETLNCSDNTVKSRLNYGRKNLKAKAEELQKKGYKLYSIAPVTLFLYLLHSEETAMAADGTLVAAGKVMQPKIFFPFEAAKGAGVSAVGSAGGNIAGATVKSGFFHTAIGKMTIVLIGTCITGSAVLFGVIQASSKSAEATVQEEIMPEEGNVMTRETPAAEQTAAAEDKAAEETTPEVEEVPSMTEMKEEDYTSLIKGNLTREEIEYVFAYGPQEMSGQGFADSDYLNFLNLFCVCSKNDGNIVKDYGNTSNWASQYSVEDVNRLFSSFTDYQYSEENDSEAEYG
ncbi:MAG: sigma-70 family RNA polymerase sigma factor, partial [Clostridia bacterium]|nr:sigma-70 family RNA polymerase sigma factor [Clostridia bacterium]